MRRSATIFLVLIILQMVICPILYALTPTPSRIGGWVNVDGTVLTQATGTGYTFKVTKEDGITDYVSASGAKAEDTNGLSSSGWYIIDIPIYDVTSQPGGANPGDKAVIHVYKNENELKVTDPVGGKFTVGASGSTKQVNLIVLDVTKISPPDVTGDTLTNDTTPSWSWSSSSQNGTGIFRYKLDDADLNSGATETTNTSYTPDTNLDEGSHTFYVQEKDSIGNWSETGNFTIIIDITCLAPTGLDLSTVDDSGNNQNDNITKNTTGLTITGSGENGASVSLYDGGIAISGATVIVSGGVFSIDISLTEGKHNITAKQTDVAGNTSAASESLNITVDTTIIPPATLDLAASDDSGSSTIDKITRNTSNLTISGTGEDGATVQLYDNGSAISGATAIVSSGMFSIDISLATGLHNITAKQTDLAGNTSTTSTTLIITVDTTAPSSSASPAGGSYNSNQQITLTCNDTGSGCSATYYTIDGNEPTTSSSQYSTAISINQNTTLKYFAVDIAGNSESINTETYIIDKVAPSISISTPEDGSSINQLYTIEGSAWDASSGVSKIELFITDGVWYMSMGQSILQWTKGESWVTANGTNSWSLNTSYVVWTQETVYTIKARATDGAGNTTITSISITYAPGELAYTILSLELSSQTILNNASIDASGKLTRLPDIGLNLAGLDIILYITAPDGTVYTYTTTTYDVLGHYNIEGISGFLEKGVYQVQASFEGTWLLYESESAVMTVLVGASAGYAVIVEGKIESEAGLDSHNKTANRIYARLKERGFLDDNIKYFNYDNLQTDVVVDAQPSKVSIQDAIEVWAAGKMNGSPAPLWIIMVDHGSNEAFYLGKETITPTDLDAWMNTLEGNLDEDALAEKRIVIIGACYSGSFIPTFSWEGRVIITSAAEDEVSYKGPMEPDDQIRSGEFFLEELFQKLKRGESLKNSFIEATEKTETFTRRGGGSANTNVFPYFDDAVQHPLLEDDDDAVGSNILYDGQGDGYVSQDIYLGVGLNYDVNSAENPAEVLEVTESLFLDTSTTSTQLWAKSNDDSQVSSLWMEIRSPAFTLIPGSGTSQLEMDIPNVFMTLNQAASRWEKTYTSFNDPGMYEIYYYASDAETGEISPMKHSVVYKAKAGNNPPATFGLLGLANAEETETILALMWNSSVDPDGDPVTYIIEIAEDTGFTAVVHRLDSIRRNYCFIGEEAGLADLTIYYWRVIAVDQYGAQTNSEIQSFNTDNTNGIPGFLIGYVFSELGQGIAGASIKSNLLTETTTSLDNGLYLFELPSGTHEITVTAQGYDSQTQSGVEVKAENYANLNVVMSSTAGGEEYINLNAGWNLISIYLQPNNTDIGTILGPILDNVISVWAYEDSKWWVYDPANTGFSDLETMEAGRGYWINMSMDATLTISGTMPSNSIAISTGWNLVGYNSGTGKDIAEALASIKDQYISVWAYVDGKWWVYDPANPGFSDLELMEPGYGYWINVKEECTWTLP